MFCVTRYDSQFEFLHEICWRQIHLNFNGFRNYFDDAREEVERNFHLLERISCRFSFECICEKITSQWKTNDGEFHHGTRLRAATEVSHKAIKHVKMSHEKQIWFSYQDMNRYETFIDFLQQIHS